jgi:GWxTD domain-containing protein
MRKVLLRVFPLVFSVFILQCASYTINVATVPAKQVEIYVNEEYKATTDSNGTAAVKIEGVSFEGTQFIEAKSADYYGFVTVSYGKNILPEMQNVYSAVNRNPTAGQRTAKMRYDIVFIVPESATTPSPRTDLKMAAPEDDAQFWDEAELDQHFEQCVYLATKNEKEAFKKLSFGEKQVFWDDFWQKRDSDRSTGWNEFKIQYFERVQHANRKFSVQPKAGWKTDRGRVWIVYGPPDEVELFPQQMEAAAHEI